YGSANNIIKNNIFYSTRSDVSGPFIDVSQSTNNTFDYNMWKVNSNYWQYKGGRSDFTSKFSSASGWEENGTVNTVDPRFEDVENGLYYLNPDSPAIDHGQDSECASTDMDLHVRLENGNRCDMGMYEANQ
ncbi:MAG: choice-of-anchor Q domain-containing protein, partial [Candidatus Dadabacteria bacterium]